MAQNKPCPICSKNLNEETWKAKSGKWYHAFRHEDWKAAETECRDVETGKPYIEFISDKKPYQKPYASKIAQNAPKIAPKGEDYQNLLNADRKLYALILAVAHIQGVKQEDIENELTRMEYEKK